ncbi:MAG: hypothetical protein ABSC53_14180 [Bacteroidota bacterium]
MANIPKRNSVLAQIINVFERVGQIGSFTLSFFYRLSCSNTLDTVLLIMMSFALVVYYTGWVRYLVKGCSETLFYKSMFGIPLPMAIMPVIYFILASILLGSTWLMISAILLGIGHITISLQSSRRIKHLTVT